MQKLGNQRCITWNITTAMDYIVWYSTVNACFFPKFWIMTPIHGWWSSQSDLLVLLAEVIRPIPVWSAESGLGTGEWQTQQTQVPVWREIYWEKIKQWPRVAEQVDQKVMLCCGKNWNAGYCDIPRSGNFRLTLLLNFQLSHSAACIFLSTKCDLTWMQHTLISHSIKTTDSRSEEHWSSCCSAMF